MNKQTFTQQIAYLSAAYEREISTEVAAVYWHQLGSLPDAPFTEAVEKHVAGSGRFPRVSELRALTQLAIRRDGPALLPPPDISTEDVLRDHARLIGADEDRYVKKILNRDSESDRIPKVHSDMPGSSAAKVNENLIVDEVLKT